MPKRKKLPEAPDYKGLGNDIANAEIQKSRPLQSLAATDLTIAEFKILDFYLARINSHAPDKRTVQLERGELEQALDVPRIRKEDLDKRLCSLFTPIDIIDENDPQRIKRIGLFERAEAVQDKDGLWIVTLTCTPSAMEYIFNVDNLGYLRYRLKNVINLTSRYSYVLFLYLLDNRFRKTWSIDLDALKELLKCTAVRYEQYKYFNAEI
jgi:plasmid replication initiation protein